MNCCIFRRSLVFAAFCGFLVFITGTAFAHAHPQETVDGQKASDSKASFDVASIKPSDLATLPNFKISPDRFGAIGKTANALIAFAYGVKEFQVEGAPEWAKTMKFDVDAKVEDSIAQRLKELPIGQQFDELRVMMQSLLVDRFKLEATRQTKTAPIYALVLAKGGPKLPEPKLAPLGPEDRGRASQNVTLAKTTLTGLANFLGAQPDVGRVVVDQTGLTGTYDLTLEWSTDISGGSGMTIFEAIQDELGLKLESRTGPIDIIVVNHIERPSAN